MSQLSQEAVDNQIRLAMLEFIVAFLLARDAAEHDREVKHLHSIMSDLFEDIAKGAGARYGLDPQHGEVRMQQMLDGIFSNAERLLVPMRDRS